MIFVFFENCSYYMKLVFPLFFLFFRTKRKYEPNMFLFFYFSKKKKRNKTFSLVLFVFLIFKSEKIIFKNCNQTWPKVNILQCQSPLYF